MSVEEALRQVLASIAGPVESESTPLSACAGRVLAADVPALRDQPPFAVSAMDGYALRAPDITQAPVTLRVIGESAAGLGFAGRVGAGEAVRIFTGAPVPPGADCIVMQENAIRQGDHVAILEPWNVGRHIRPAGLDFKAGEVRLKTGDRVDARRLALAAAMGHGALPLRRKPRIAVLATGDELVRAGDLPASGQIVASSLPAILAMAEKAGAEAIDLGIARDTFESLAERLAAAKAARIDLLVTLGGASVGDHDLVQEALAREGMNPGFWKVALRPGKPLMHGKIGPMTVLGLPGNPVSSIVCAILFLVPAIEALLGRADADRDPTGPAILGIDLPPNGDRQDYMRATLSGDGIPVATPHPVQDSSMLGVLAQSDALLVRAPHAPAERAGCACRIIRFCRY